MRVAICIVGFKNAEDITRCLACLTQSTYQNYEVIICENGGGEAYDLLVSLVPFQLRSGQKVSVIKASRNLGYAGGVNECIGYADAEAWWILNPDTLPYPSALEQLVKRLSRGDCGIVGGILCGQNGTVQSCGLKWRSFFARPVAIGRKMQVRADLDPAKIEREIDAVSGASMLVSRVVTQKVGLMREDYFLYCEEVEWCLRAAAKGIKIGFSPGAIVVHEAGSTTGSKLDVQHRPRVPIYLDERNKILTIRDTSPNRLFVAVPSAFILLCLRFLRPWSWKQWTWALAGWWAGIGDRRGVPEFVE